MLRADLLLVEQALVTSRSQAQRLILANGVQWQDLEGHWHTLKKTNHLLPHTTPLRLMDTSETLYVSRGGLKLAAALQHCAQQQHYVLNVTGMHCLDIGQSTGGFTDCLLQHGAATILGVDVGHSQLHEQLRDDTRVRFMEKINARELPASLLDNNHGKPFDLAVMDVSFISQTLILPSLTPLIQTGGYLLSLVKPQFEIGENDVDRKQYINKKGIVKNEQAFVIVEQRIREAYTQANFQVLDYFASATTGTDGNREFFILAQKTGN